MDRQRLADLIDKYLSNQCSAEEREALEAWYRGHDAAENYLDRLSPENRAALGEDLLSKIHARLDGVPAETPDNIRVTGLVLPLGRWLRRAAIVLIVAGAALTAYWLIPRAGKQYETAYGERNAITLPDGSRVVLNGHSTLRSSSNWSTAAAREVWLDGEAFFSVTHMRNNQRFVVHTADGLSIEVLGTSFNVKKRGEATQVVLREGKIRLHLPAGHGVDTLTMKPGDLVEIGGAANAFTREVVQPEKYTAWQNPNISFSNTTLRDVLASIQETYGDEIEITDPSLAERKISGTVPNDNLDLLLKAVGEILDCRIEHRNNRIIVSAK